MANRVKDMIERYQAKIDKVDTDKLEKLNKDLATSWKDLVEYQSLQASAHAAGKITTEEAKVVYEALGGENPTEEKWNKLPLATKVTITQLMNELLEWRIKLGPGQVIARTVYTASAKSGKGKGSHRTEMGHTR